MGENGCKCWLRGVRKMYGEEWRCEVSAGIVVLDGCGDINRKAKTQVQCTTHSNLRDVEGTLSRLRFGHVHSLRSAPARSRALAKATCRLEIHATRGLLLAGELLAVAGVFLFISKLSIWDLQT